MTMTFNQEVAFIEGLAGLAITPQDLKQEEAVLAAAQRDLEAFLDAYELSTIGLTSAHPLVASLQRLEDKKDAMLPAWREAKDNLAPALTLAEQFADKFMFLVFGKFNAGKSSFCNLIAERFKFQGRTVQPFILEDGVIRHHNDIFQEGSTETTAHIQGIILDDRLVLIDTPGLHSITSENAQLTQQFLESADGILWLSSSTSPGQVQELDELAQEIRRNKPLLPIITRSDFLDEVFVDNDIKKVLCNKSPENRQIQEEDVHERAQDKLRQLELRTELVQQPISISVHYARQHQQTDEALTESGIYTLYQGLLDLAKPMVDYKARKPLEVYLHYLDEVVVHDIDALLEDINERQEQLTDEAEKLNAAVAEVVNSTWKNTLGALPKLMDKFLTSVSENPSKHLNSELAELVRQQFKEAIRNQLGRYVVDSSQLLLDDSPLTEDIILSAETYEACYLAVEKNLEERLANEAKTLILIGEAALNQIQEQLDTLADELTERKAQLINAQ